MAAALHVAAVALGSNLGDRSAHIAYAFDAIGALPGTRLVARSGLFETEPVGPEGQGLYLNAAAAIETRLPPRALLDGLLEIERARGRNRASEERWGARTLDLDLLLYDEVMIDEPGLTVPHPRLAERRFVLAPLAEIMARAIVPGHRASVRELLDRLEGRGRS